MTDRDFIELEPSEDDQYEYRSREGRPQKPVSPLKAKIIFWSIVIGGIAVGTVIFLTFLSLFIYFFIPIMVMLGVWMLVRKLFR